MITRALSVGLICGGVTAGAAFGQIVVNVDATRYGFAFPTDPAPVPGQIVTPITNPSGLPRNQVTLGPGRYRVSNATGRPGANPAFTAWNFSGGWVWSIVLANDATGAVLAYTDAPALFSTQAQAAASPLVAAVSTTFTLSTTTTVDFFIRDYFLPDNQGGVAVLIALLCGQSDVAGANQAVGGDGVLTADDIIVFLGWFFAADSRANVAGPNQSTVPDNAFTADDVIVFLSRYFAGC